MERPKNRLHSSLCCEPMGLSPLIVAGWQPTSPKCPLHYEWQLTKSPPLDLPTLQLASLSILSPDRVYYIGMDIFIRVQVCLPMCTHVRGQCQMSFLYFLGVLGASHLHSDQIICNSSLGHMNTFFFSPSLELAVSARVGVQWVPCLLSPLWVLWLQKQTTVLSFCVSSGHLKS